MKHLLPVVLLVLLAACGSREAGKVGEGDSLQRAGAGVGETRVETVAVPPEVQQRADPELPVGMAYVQQPGTAGHRRVTWLVPDGVRDGRRVAREEMVDPGQPTVILSGSRPVAEVRAAGRRLVERYLAGYQARAFEQLAEVAVGSVPERMAAVNRAAGMEIVAFSVQEAGEPRALPLAELGQPARNVFRPSVGRDPSLPGSPFTEPFGLEMRVPFDLRYRVLGVELAAADEMVATWQPGEPWRLHYWGVLAASRPDRAPQLGEGTVRITGLALLSHGTVLTLTHPGRQPLTVRLQDEAGHRFVAPTSQAEAGAYVQVDALDPASRAVTVVVRAATGFSHEEAEVTLPLSP